MKTNGKLYSVKKVRPSKDGDRKHYTEVGTLLLREGGKHGVLFLHLLDGEYAVFERDRAPEGEDNAND